MKSIRRQLIFTLLPAILLLAILSSVLLYFYARQVLTRQFDNALLAKAKAIAAAVTWDDEHPTEVISPDVAAAEFSRGHHASYFQARWADGRIALQSKSLKDDNLPKLPDASEGVSPFADITLPSRRRGRAVAIVFSPIRDADDLQDLAKHHVDVAAVKVPLTLVVAQSRSGVDEPLETLAIALGGGAFLTACITVVIVAIAVRRSLRPLTLVTEEAARRSDKLLDQKFPITGMPAELVPICLKLNELLSNVQDALRRERRFTADVSHELRTPIAELKTLAEVALKFPTDAANYQAAFHDALDVAGQMESIVITLLSLARSESHQLALHREMVNAAELVKTIYDRELSRASSRFLNMSLDILAEVRLETDRTLLGSVISNLISNAVDHTPAGGSVTCRLARDGDKAFFEVTNSVQAMGPEDVKRMFEPFWQKDRARTPGKHSGLGLSIAESYATAMRYQLTAELLAGDLLKMRLRF